MTKNYQRLLKINKSVSTSKINDESKKPLTTTTTTITNENIRRHSKKLMEKFRKITSQTSSDERNLLEISSSALVNRTNSQNTSPTADTPQISSEERQIKSILKISTSLNTRTDSVNVSQTNDELDLSKTIKHVRFNENISRKRYNANLPVSGLMKLSRRQMKKLRKLQRKDSLELQPTDNQLSNKDVLIFDSIDEDQSSDEEVED